MAVEGVEGGGGRGLGGNGGTAVNEASSNRSCLPGWIISCCNKQR